MEFIGMSLLERSRPVAATGLAKLAAGHKFSGRFHLLSRHSLKSPSVIFEVHAATMAHTMKTGVNAGRSGMATAYSQYSDFFLYFAHLKRALPKSKANIEIVDMSETHYGGWFS